MNEVEETKKNIEKIQISKPSEDENLMNEYEILLQESTEKTIFIERLSEERNQLFENLERAQKYIEQIEKERNSVVELTSENQKLVQVVNTLNFQKLNLESKLNSHAHLLEQQRKEEEKVEIENLKTENRRLEYLLDDVNEDKTALYEKIKEIHVH